ncbi:hypothetical protein [Aquimarina sp. 2201CG14-23]|uniref:hypothetical protein n=1 Tax=Aquimarina mycalae TaxID=3040073 RepID=UPI002478089F|nr:hypothetical protein [Aquimarina sp. 2201CG14-23]MDH7447589.1 hypothetical protein [Aquimarina sp. 2201CG14-23]
MGTTKTEIYFVLDKNWEKDLYSLSQKHPIWICNSNANDIRIRDVWKKENGQYNPNRGVTSFEIKDTTENTFYDFLGIIDDHHQKGYSNIEEWNKISVFGIDFKKVGKIEIQEILGFDIEINVIDDCFEIIKK